MSKRNIFGWDLPAGAANDPRAPYNQPDPLIWICPACELEYDNETAEDGFYICEPCDAYLCESETGLTHALLNEEPE